MALSPDGRTAYASLPLSAYDVVSGRRLYAREREVGGMGVRQSATNFFELNPAGTLLAVTEPPDRLLLLDARTGRTRRELHGHSDQVRSLRFSHDGTSLASSSWDRTAVIWDVATGAPRERLQLGEGAIGLAFGPDDSTLYSAGEDRAVRAWDLRGESQFLATVFRSEPKAAGDPLPAPGGRHVVNWLGDTLRFHDVGAQRWTRDVRQELSHEAVTWSPDGTRVATVGDGFLQVWDPTTAELLDEASLDGVFVGVDFSPDGTRIAVLNTDGELSMREAATLDPVGEAMELDTSGGALSLGPAGRALVLSPGYVLDYTFDHVSRQWLLVDLDTGQQVRRGRVDFDAGWLATAPDGRHAAITGTAGELVVLDLATGDQVRPPTTGHATTVWATEYSADGSRIVTTGRDGSVSLWDGPTGELLGSVVLPEKVTVFANFGADDRTIVITTSTGSLYYWDTSTEHAIEFACRLAGRDLAEAEWPQYFGARPWQPTCPADPLGG